MVDQLETLTSQTLEINAEHPNLEDNANQLASGQHRERMSSLIVIGLIALLTGMAFALILPTAWGYINTFVSGRYADIAMGLLLSVFALAAAIAGLIFGYLYDIGISLKRLILFGTMFQIIGNIFYFIGINIYVVVTSRFITGIGMGIVPLLLAEVSRRSAPETRTQLLTKILGCRQIGLVLGPSITLFLEPLNFTMFGLPVTVNNAPGLLLATLWFIMLIVTIFFFHDLVATIPVPKSVSNILRTYSSKDVCTRICRMCKQPVIIVLLIATFIAYFNQTALSTSLTPFTSYAFHWTSFQVSILYAFVGVELILVYVLLHFVTKKFLDQTILLFGFTILSTACLIGVLGLLLCEPDSKLYLPLFLLFVIMNIFSAPLIIVTTTSLFIQESKDDEQGVGQGIQRAVVSIAAILGPLYAGALLQTIWIVVLSLLIGAVIAIILIEIVYRSFRPKTTDESSSLIPLINKDS